MAGPLSGAPGQELPDVTATLLPDCAAPYSAPNVPRSAWFKQCRRIFENLTERQIHNALGRM